MMTDPRIISLAKDPRTGLVLVSIVESGGASVRASSAMELASFELAAFDCAMAIHGADAVVRDARALVPVIVSDLLAYVRSVADEADVLLSRWRFMPGGPAEMVARLKRNAPDRFDVEALVAEVLRGDRFEAWAAEDVRHVEMALALAGLLVQGEGSGRRLTPLGRAVLLVLEHRAAGAGDAQGAEPEPTPRASDASTP